MIDPNEIDAKFDSDNWNNITRLTGKESQEELTAKINEMIDHVNYLFRFLIGKPD